MDWRRILFWLAVIAFAAWVIDNPPGAVDDGKAILRGLAHGAEALITFVRAVFS